MPETLLRLVNALADRYRIDREIGSGGMATVYLAEDLKHHRQVAIKVLRPELSAVLGGERFLKEIELTASLQHPHILPLFDSGTADGLLYYVMPLIQGESLRARLTRERQLPIGNAVAIATQVASALDYAHKRGVVHRDIKPENILLQDGDALVADFGIALALRDAGGDRLTQTGLSLGTPHYMSPEQASGDRNVDARSDVYALGAVLHEMLAGEPPFSGTTAQAVIAKLMVEEPPHLRVVRSTVPPALDAAVHRALAKTPADRFASCGELIEALNATTNTTVALPTARRRRYLLATALAVLAALGAVVAWRARTRAAPPPSAAMTLRDRVQVTSSGQATLPVLSADGKQVAYVARHCEKAPCTFSLEVQDLESGAQRRVADLGRVDDVNSLRWSPDQRHFIAWVARGEVLDALLIPALGGTQRSLGDLGGDFYAGGDSLLIAVQAPTGDSTFWIRIASLDGTAHDSIRVLAAPGSEMDVNATPDKGMIVATIFPPSSDQYTLLALNRRGQVLGRLPRALRAGFNPQFSNDAAWSMALPGSREDVGHIIRVPFDPASGRFADRPDTVYSGRLGSFTVTPDGRTLAMDATSTEFNGGLIDFSAALRGREPEGPTLLHSSTPFSFGLSPDGSRLLVRRATSSAQGVGLRVSIRPLSVDSEIAIPSSGQVVRADWLDSATVALQVRDAGSTRLILVDAGTAAIKAQLRTADSLAWMYQVDGKIGWASISPDGSTVVIRNPDDSTPRTTALGEPVGLVPPSLSVSPDGKALAILVTTGNGPYILKLSALSLTAPGAAPLPWAAVPGNSGSVRWLSDGSLLLMAFLAGDGESFYRVQAPGVIDSLGTTSPQTWTLSVSRDLKRAAMVTQDVRADVWVGRVDSH